MSVEFTQWRKTQPIWTRIVMGPFWSGVANVLTPAHFLRERALRHEITVVLFGEAPDPNDPPRWFEVLTLGFVKRRYVRTANDASGRSV